MTVILTAFIVSDTTIIVITTITIKSLVLSIDMILN